MLTQLVGRRQHRVVRGVRVLLLVLLAGYAVRSLTPLRDVGPARVGHAHFYVVAAGSALLVVLRAAWGQADRRAWAVMAAGMVSYGLGFGWYFQVVITLDAPSYPTLADAGWLLSFPVIYVAVVLLLRRRVVRLRASVWLDGLVVGLGVAAFFVAFVLPTVLQSTGGRFVVVATNLSYPIADLLLITLLLGVFALFGWRPGSMWWLLGAGVVLFTVADTAFLFATANDTYAPGGLVDLGWLAGLVLMAHAAWQPEHDTLWVRPQGWAVLFVPFMFSLFALGLLLYAGTHAASPWAVMLAAASVAAALVRTALTFREVWALNDARLEARTDELTELPNRRSFLEQTQVALDRREPGGRLVLLLIDLDRFKEINDSFGHQLGDTLLRLVGPRLAAVLRGTDVVARLGGDEFGIVLVDADRAYACQVAGRLRNELRRPFELEGLSVTIDASIGIALCPDHGQDTNVLLQRADIAMYEAKDARSGFEIYRVDGDQRSRQRLETVQQLRAAIDKDQLVLHYQPKLDLATGRVVGVEALVRWEHPTRGLLHPDGFLSLAEQAGLMRLLTLAVLEKAVRQVADWRKAGLAISVAVNLSASDLQESGLPAQVQLLLDALDVPTDALELEITENVLIADPDRALKVLNGLRALGLRLSVDDYGTGYSSLAYLRALPVQELKLDRAFVAHLDTDPRSAAIAVSTIALAHSLDMVMVAEGVESEEVLRRLTEAGCDLAQGHHIARPQPAEKLTGWLLEAAAAAAAGGRTPASRS